MEVLVLGELSTKETEILQYIRECIDNGIPPTVREICKQLGYRSTSTAYRYLCLLEEKGYIEKKSGYNRCIRLTSSAMAKVPLLGTVRAGEPILAAEEIEDYIAVNTRYSAEELFALRVKGASMIEAGILDGDIIVAKKTPVAENGEIVVALLGEEATVKVFYKEDGHFRLQPCNATMEPIICDHVSIVGKVVALVRSYDK